MLARTMVYCMSNFSVGKSSQKGEITFPTGRTSDFTRAKTKYRDHKEKVSQSDFANSPVALEKEMTMLVELLALAKKEKLHSEIKWIEPKLAEVKEQLTSSKIDFITNAYYMPIVRTGNAVGLSDSQEIQEKNLLELLDTCKTSEGLLDPNAEKLLLALKGKDDSLSHIKQILEMSRGEDGLVNPQMASAVEIMSAVNIKPSRILEQLPNISSYDSTAGSVVVDFETLEEATNLVNKGLNDVDAFNFANYLKGNFEDKDSVRTSFLNLKKKDIESKHAFGILNALSVRDVETGKINICPKAVNAVALLKHSMASTRINETNERRSPLARLGVQTFSLGEDSSFMMKDGKVISRMSLSEETPEDLKKKYDALVVSIEDDMCLEFAQKYKDQEGHIDRKYLRVAHFLRQNAGFVYTGLFKQVDAAIKEDGSIDNDRLDAIKELRTAGVLCDDIDSLLDVCRKDEQGLYNKDDIKDICDLTSCVVGGKEVSSLVPEFRGNEDVKDIVFVCAESFSDPKKLLDVIPLLKTPEGQYGENEVEMFGNLAQVYFSDPSNYGDEKNFLKLAKEIMTISRGAEGTITDDAGGICAIMKHANEPIESIKMALMVCRNSENIVDEKLAEILWDMYLQGASLPEVIDLINVCKPDFETVDYSKADMILSLLENKFPKEKIMELVKH